MDALAFRRACELFDMLIELPEDERAKALPDLCTDLAIRAQVLALLAADARGAVFEHDAARARDALVQEGAPESLPRVAAWRVLREVGRGGMGVVWLAQRSDGGFNQRGALKLIKRGMDSDQIVARFLRERQLLARLEHPGLARLLDGGMSDEGLPYFVMEFVDGTDICAHVRSGGLTLEARLNLFLQVCAAVAYAHRQLVVHRDIKPSNVMVDGDGAVRLLDFGIAKLLADEADATATHGTPLTPHYAAPEQRRGEAVSTATDVYALGALLYELLSGARVAIAAPTLAPPSARAEAMTNDADAVVPPISPRRLRGDLDTIVLRALEPEAEARYASVDALAEDVRRHLQGLPILARRPRLTYRLRKFMGRHRWSVGIAAAACVALVLALGLALDRGRAARAEAARSRAVETFLTGLFRIADPSVTAGGYALRVKDIVDAGAQQLERGSELPDDVSRDLALLLGTIYRQLGDADRAIALMQPDSVGSGDVVRARERAYQLGLAYVDKEDSASSQHWAQTLLDASDGVATAFDARGVARAWMLRSEAARSAGDYVLAVQHGQRAVDAARTLGEHDPVLGDALVAYAGGLWSQGSVAAARPLIEQALKAYRDANASATPAAIEAGNNLAILMIETGDLDGAGRQLELTLSQARRLFPPAHPTIANLLGSQAKVLDLRGDSAQAAATMRSAIDVFRQSLGEQSLYFAGATNGLASILENAGDLKGAAIEYQRALTTMHALALDGHPWAINYRVNLANVQRQIGATSEAVALASEARDLISRSDGAPSKQSARALDVLAAALRDAGRVDAAQQVHRDAAAAYAAAKIDSGTGLARSLLESALTDSAQGNATQAVARLREALALVGGDSTAARVTRIDVLDALAPLLAASGHSVDARQANDEAAGLSQSTFGAQDWRRARTQLASMKVNGIDDDPSAKRCRDLAQTMEQALHATAFAVRQANAWCSRNDSGRGNPSIDGSHRHRNAAVSPQQSRP